MRVEIIEITPIYPQVYVVKEGSFNPQNMSAEVICKVHIDVAEKIKSMMNSTTTTH